MNAIPLMKVAVDSALFLLISFTFSQSSSETTPQSEESQSLQVSGSFSATHFGSGNSAIGPNHPLGAQNVDSFFSSMGAIAYSYSENCYESNPSMGTSEQYSIEGNGSARLSNWMDSADQFGSSFSSNLGSQAETSPMDLYGFWRC